MSFCPQMGNYPQIWQHCGAHLTRLTTSGGSTLWIVNRRVDSFGDFWGRVRRVDGLFGFESIHSRLGDFCVTCAFFQFLVTFISNFEVWTWYIARAIILFFAKRLFPPQMFHNVACMLPLCSSKNDSFDAIRFLTYGDSFFDCGNRSRLTSRFDSFPDRQKSWQLTTLKVRKSTRHNWRQALKKLKKCFQVGSCQRDERNEIWKKPLFGHFFGALNKVRLTSLRHNCDFWRK
jgi:hypothetical protein